MTLEFKVDGQRLTRLDLETVASNALNFVACSFDVSPEWFEITPYTVLKAVFERDGQAYGVLLDYDRRCTVPHEVLAEAGIFHVSLHGLLADEEGTPIRATANRIAVEVCPSGAKDTVNSSAPTVGELEQIEEKLAELGRRITCLSSINAAHALCAVEGAEYHFIWIAPHAEFDGPGGLQLRTGGLYSIVRQGSAYTVTLTADLKGAAGEAGEKGEKGDKGDPGEPLKIIGGDELEGWCRGLGTTAYCLAREDIEYSFTCGTAVLEGRMAAGDVYSYDPDTAELSYHFSLRGEPDAETVTVLSDNLFDKTAVLGAGVFSYDSTHYQLVEGGDSRYAFVPLRGAGTYRTLFNTVEHEWSGARIALTDAQNNWITNAAGTITPTDREDLGELEFTVTQDMISMGAAKIAFDVWVGYLDTIMIVKDRDYPDSYIPYGYIERATVNAKKVSNPLTERSAVFLGDSICAGNTTLADAPEYGYGWGGLIGEANLMSWQNLGRDGGTVTELAEVGSGFWLTSQLAAAQQELPEADYVIFEGGCNDADRMGDALLGEIAAGYDGFDTATFSGAMESFILKLLTAYPKAKIGYLIPPRMYKVADHSAKGHVHRRFFDRAAEICRKWGIPVLDLWQGCPLNPALEVYFDPDLTPDEANAAGKCYTDGQHLTLAGYRAIVPAIESWMRDLYAAGGAPVSGSSGVEAVHVTTSDNETFYADKTYQEISAGIKAGRQYICHVSLGDKANDIYQDGFAPLSFFSENNGDDMIVFSAILSIYSGISMVMRACITSENAVTAEINQI